MKATILSPAKNPRVPDILKSAFMRGRRMVRSPAKKRLMEIATEAP
jgi:hypothetical protein